jgi:hypothetical protein
LQKKGEPRNEIVSMFVIRKISFLFDSPDEDVMQCARAFDANWAGHKIPNIKEKSRKSTIVNVVVSGSPCFLRAVQAKERTVAAGGPGGGKSDLKPDSVLFSVGI